MLGLQQHAVGVVELPRLCLVGHLELLEPRHRLGRLGLLQTERGIALESRMALFQAWPLRARYRL